MDATAQELIARLRRNPDDSEAFGALRAHYQRIGDYASLANLLEGWAGRARDKSAGAQALYDAGELVLGALADRERAIRIYERALASWPLHQDAYLRLRGLFEDAKEMRRLCELLDRQGAALASSDPREAALAYHQLGEIWQHHFTRADKAVQHYRRAFELDGSLVPAIYAAREIYRQSGNTKAATSLLEREAKAEPDPARRVALWRELAHVRGGELDDPEGAALALKRAMADAPNDIDVMNDLARIYLARAARSEDPHIAASDRLRGADLLYQMAQKVSPEHALTYLGEALDIRPDHDAALALIERLAAEQGQSDLLPSRWVAYLEHAGDRPEAKKRRKRLANAYLEAGQLEYAITCFEWLLAAGDSEAAEHLLPIYRKAGRDDDAIRALGVLALSLPTDTRVPRLRELIGMLRDRGDLAAATGYAREILNVDPSDPEALNVLEDACRQSGDYAPLRDGLLAASRAGGLSLEARKQRLREVAMLSENKLSDPDGAVSAWRGVTTLDPADREARAALKRLLTSMERWDDLSDVLDREALAASDASAKADIHRQLAQVHRERRQDLPAAIVALRHVRELAPDDAAARDALCEVLIEAGAMLEAVPLLRQRADAASGETKVELLRVLATVLEEHIGDEDGAFEAWARLLDESPNDLSALEHMEAIDQAAGRHERLLSTLSYRLEVIEPERRPLVLARMAEISGGALGDLDRAAELYQRALELAPGEPDILDALCDLYDRAERYRDLVVLLRNTANAESDLQRRAELYRRIAITLADRVGSDDGAAEAWREVLRHREDPDALRFLRRHATRTNDPTELEDVLRRIAALPLDPDEARDILIERAELLAERLERPHDAIAVLRRVVDELSPEHIMALGRLASLCERVGDPSALADALWRQLVLVHDPALRVPLAHRLADLHETSVPDPARAIEALNAWSQTDPNDVEPLRRSVPLLEQAARWSDLTAVLDCLAELETDPSDVSRRWRHSAEVAHQKLGDVEGAWRRLEPRLREGDADAEKDLRSLARASGRADKLAELYLALAQSLAEPNQHQRWMEAAAVYEQDLGDPGRALESVLRAFAIDLSDRACLGEADRLAERAGAWVRLGQVYETLIKRSNDPAEKVELLLRHAALLDQHANDVSAALDQTLRACSLAPLDDAVLALAEERAPRAARADELLVTYDKRRQKAADDAGRVEALLRSVRLCEVTLRDRTRTSHYLAQAVALTVRSPELDELVERTVCELDAREGSPGGLRRALVDLEAKLGEDMDADPRAGAQLLARAARLLSRELKKDAEAFDLVVRAAELAPSEEAVLDELESVGRTQRRWADVEACYGRLIEEALDGRTAMLLLRRHGRLLDEELGDSARAAEVWRRLATMAGADAEARAHLRASLRKAGKHQDLLVALQRELTKSTERAARIAVLKEIATVWEKDLANRWEALDAWKKVQKEAADDADAKAALARLGQEKRKSEPDSESDVGSPEVVPPPSTDQQILVPEAARQDEFKDMTEPSDEEPVSVDSSETILDPGLYLELLGEKVARARNTPSDRVTSTLEQPPKREPDTRLLRTTGARPAPEPSQRNAIKPPPPAPPALLLPGPSLADDFDDEETSVAEDVFDQLDALPLRRPNLRDTIDADPNEVEIELASDEASAQSAELLADSDLEDLDAVDDDDIEELDPPITAQPPPTTRPPRRHQ